MDEEGCTGIQFLNPFCQAKEGAEALVSEAIENLATAVSDAAGRALASLGTLWVNIETPDLTGSGGGSGITPGETAPLAGNVTQVLGYVVWIGLAIAVVSVVALGALMWVRHRSGEGVMAIGRLGLVLVAVILLSGGSALVAGVLPDGPSGVGGAVGFLQSGLWWYMGVGAIVSVVIGAIRMIWEQRAEPGREVVRSLITLVVVAGAGVTMVSLLVGAADEFSVWLLNRSLACDVSTDSACFTTNLGSLVWVTSASSTLGVMLVILLGLAAVLASIFQIVLMAARGGMLVILTGILPLAASFTNTEMGKSWFRKAVGWLTAFILYKPAAAIVYAAAFQLAGSDVFRDDGTGLVAIVSGLMLMVIALFALPALLRFVTPMVGAMAGGAAGGAMAAGLMTALPTGAIQISNMMSNRDGGGSAPTGASSTAPNGSAAAAVPAGGGTAAGGAGAGASAGAAGGAAAGGAAAGGAVTGEPVSTAVLMGLQKGKEALDKGVAAVQSASDGATNEGSA